MRIMDIWVFTKLWILVYLYKGVYSLTQQNERSLKRSDFLQTGTLKYLLIVNQSMHRPTSFIYLLSSSSGRGFAMTGSQ